MGGSERTRNGADTKILKKVLVFLLAPGMVVATIWYGTHLKPVRPFFIFPDESIPAPMVSNNALVLNVSHATNVSRHVNNANHDVTTSNQGVIHTSHGIINTNPDFINASRDAINANHDVINGSHDVINANHHVINAHHDVIKIAYWAKKTSPFWPQSFNNCAIPEHMQCEHRFTMEDPIESDAIVFRAPTSYKGKTLPSARRPDQKWLFMDREAPANHPRDWRQYSDVFNVSATFARDSDVPFYYGHCMEEPTEGFDPSFDHAKGKIKLVAWMAGNCRANSRRQEYIRDMQKHVTIDIYGKCGTLKCPHTPMGACEQILQQYKFYLAFENAFCRDYITEKLWRTFRLGIVPVVYGGADYRAILPPHSFIDVRDFKSPKDLVEHLQVVASNITLYNEYFLWKRTHLCEEKKGLYNLPCDICQYLHRTRHQHSSLDPYGFWDKDKHCITVATFRKQCNCWP